MTADLSKKIDAIKTVCALGTGTMGAGTALCFAMAGCDVRLYARTEASLEKGMQGVRSALEFCREHGLVREENVSAILARIKPTTSLKEAATGADFVIESIAEDMEVKKKVFAELDKICPPHAIFATNTSALSPTKIAEAVTRKDKFVVTHCFNPPHLMPLVEVVPGEHTSKETMDIAYGLMGKAGKKPVRLQREAPGFIVNYIQVAVLWAALDLIVSGAADAHTVDTAFKHTLGRPYENAGPLQNAGLGSIDAAGAARLLAKQPVRPEGDAPAFIEHFLRDAALRAALELRAKEVAGAQEIDNAFKYSLGRRYRETGPLESADLGGLDIFQEIFRSLGYLEQESEIAAFLRSTVEQRKLGAKTGEGIYPWPAERQTEVKTRRAERLLHHLREDAQQDGGAVKAAQRPVQVVAEPHGSTAAL